MTDPQSGHLLDRSASVRQIQKLLGHASIETTACYLGLETESLRAAIEQAHPAEGSLDEVL